MGIEHFLVCKQCKTYIDLHKAYEFSAVINCQRPPVGIECEETDFNDPTFKGGYWAARGLWFLWKHRGHKDVEIMTDCGDEFYEKIYHNFTEEYPHNDDLKIRKRVENKNGE